MTVADLYFKLKEEIAKGHGDIPVMIHDNIDNDDGGYTEFNELQSTWHYNKSNYWPEHLEIGRY